MCMFEGTMSDTKRQEMSREKLLSKLFMSVQAFTYSCSCEGFEARRAHRKSLSFATPATKNHQESSASSVLSRYGMAGIDYDGNLILLPPPSCSKDDGLQPFDGRLGKLRYLGLAIASAAGAVSADLVQLALSFPVEVSAGIKEEQPERAPVAYPMLLGHVLTHVVAAMCAACGRARAESDSIDLWQISSFLGSHNVQNGSKRVDEVTGDCEAFIKLGILARTLQVLLGKLRVPSVGITNAQDVLLSLRSKYAGLSITLPAAQKRWIVSCLRLLESAISGSQPSNEGVAMHLPDVREFLEACAVACDGAVSLLSELGTIFQVLVPGVMARYEIDTATGLVDFEIQSSFVLFEKLCSRFKFETIEVMLESALAQELVAAWYTSACCHAVDSACGDNESGSASSLRCRLRRTQGFRSYDWPSSGAGHMNEVKGGAGGKPRETFPFLEQPHDDPPTRAIGIEGEQSLPSDTDMLTLPLVSFSSKKSVPLLGGFATREASSTGSGPRVAAIPTSYTDLYAELGALLPDSEQTGVCLICGEVLNAGGKGECTKHSYKCGAGAGMFFLLQECSGLIMHKSKAAYIHSPYVDSHGETPQFRGRPLNLDLDRYEHLREVWFGHGVRQQVVAERGHARQVILPDFY
jgi:hypothetical protein